MTKLSITRFAGLTATHGRQVVVSWAALVTLLTTPLFAVTKASAPAWSPAIFNGTRSNANVVSLAALVLDFDDGLSVDDAVHIAAGLAGAWHTSWSHAPEKARFRLVLALSRSVSPMEYGRIWAWASKTFTYATLGPDPACKDAARAWFLPVKRPGFTAGILRGAPVDADAILASSTPAVSPPAREGATSLHECGLEGPSAPGRRWATIAE